MQLLFISGEFSPLCGDSPTGNMVAHLCGALCNLGHKVMTCVPMRYPEAIERYSLARRLTPMEIDLPGAKYALHVFDGRLPSGVRVSVVAHDELFKGRPATTEDQDEPLRHMVLAKASIALAQTGREPWHIVHGVGLPGALALLLASRSDRLAAAKRLFFVDHFDIQGRCHSSWVERLGLGWEEFTPEGFEFFGDLNLLKVGLIKAHRLVLDGPSQMIEARTAEGASGLDGVMNHRCADMIGLIPGLNFARWNPATDALIPARFDAEQPDGKRACKAELQHHLGLPVRSETTLVGMVSPLNDLSPALSSCLDKMLRNDIQLVAPRGLNASLEGTLNELEARLPRKIARLAADERGWHQMLAGADMVLIDAPRRCDAELLLAALRYGALPVVRLVGLARDLVVDLAPDLKSGNGFLVRGDEPEELLAVLRRAYSVCRRGPAFGELLRRVMGENSSWEATAQRLEQVYAEILPVRTAQTPEPCAEPQVVANLP